MGRAFGSDGSFHVAVYSSHDASLIAWNFSACPEGFEGVSLRRRREDTGEEWDLGEGQLVQRFCFGDYTLPAARVTYLVSALTQGKVSHRVELRGLGIVDALAELPHAVFFNRGVAGSQRYAGAFPGQEMTPEKLAWLGKGLDVALFRFCALATGPRHELLVCAYELTLSPFLEALKSAVARGVRVRVIYDYKTKGVNLKDTTQDAKTALDGAGFPQECLIQRTQQSSAISHNKFIVLVTDGVATRLWTGSANFTAGGVYGQLNAAHAISDPQIALPYKQYWDLLSSDPAPSKLKPELEKLTPLPATLKPRDQVVVFCPRITTDLLLLQAAVAESATESTFMTAAFGVNPLLQSVMSKPSAVERYLLLESTAKMTQEFQDLPHLKNRISVGSFLEKKVADVLELETEELSGLNKHVKFVHTKLLLVDMFSSCPVVVFGSGNFSEASVNKNDENQILVRGDTELADQVLVHLFRVFFHFRWRKQLEKELPEENFLKKKRSPHWCRSHFVAGSEKERQKNLMCPIGADGAKKEHESLVLDLAAHVGKASKMAQAPKAAKSPSESGSVASSPGSAATKLTGVAKATSSPAKPKQSRIVKRNEDGKFEVTFAFDAAVVEAIKRAIPGSERSYNGASHVWTVNATSEEALLTFATEFDFIFLR